MLGHLSYLNEHHILSGIEKFFSELVFYGCAHIETEADLYAKKFMRLSDENYIECIKIVRKDLKRKYKNDEFILKLVDKVCDGRMNRVLSRA